MASRLAFLWSLLGLSLLVGVVATSSVSEPVEVSTASAAAAVEAPASLESAPLLAAVEQASAPRVVQTCPYPGGDCPEPPPVCGFSITREEYTYEPATDDIAAVFAFVASPECGIASVGSIRVSDANSELGRADGTSTIEVSLNLPCSPIARQYRVEALDSADGLNGEATFNLGPPSGTCPMQPPVAACTFTGVGEYVYSAANDNIEATLTFTVAGCQTASIEAFDGTPDDRGDNVNFLNEVTTVSLMATLPCVPEAMPYTVEAFDDNAESVGLRTFQLGPPPGTCLSMQP